MNAVTRDVKGSRSKITKTARKRLGPQKIAARRAFRSRLKAADRRTEFQGHVSPAYTKLNIT